MARAFQILVVFLLVQFNAGVLLAEEGNKGTAVRSEMGSVYNAFRQLWEYSIQEDDFLSGEHDEEISKLLAKLDSSFHSDQLSKSRYAQEPTFRFLLQSLGRMVEDAKLRFGEGKRGYALWKTKSLSNYCISCHTRIEGASFDFVGDKEMLAKVKDPLDKANYLLASRQFDAAAKQFFAIAENANTPFARETALAKWLMIKTRVEAEPKQALAQLQTFQKKKGLSRKEKAELELWERGLSEWVKAGGKKSKQSVEELLKIAGEKEDAFVGGGVIEYLRTTAMLHQQLQKPMEAEEEGKKLYQLAQAYSDLQGYFSYELPELFLERAIRLQPDTDLARRSFKLYERLVLGAYSGSGGTHLPDDVKLHTKELENLAYGVVPLSGRV